MKKIKMKPSWINYFFNFKGTEKHVFEDNENRIYDTFIIHNDPTKLGVWKAYVKDPIAFLHKKLMGCYVIFSPCYLKCPGGKFDKKSFEDEKKKLKCLHKKIYELGRVYSKEQSHLQAQISILKVINEQNKKQVNLNTIKRLKEKIAPVNYSIEDLEKRKREIKERILSKLQDHGEIVIYAYAVGKNQEGKEFVIPNRLAVDFSSRQSSDEKELTFTIQVINSTFLGVEQGTDEFKKVIQNEPYVNSFNNAFYFFIKHQYFNHIDELEEHRLNIEIENQIYNNSPIQEKTIYSPYMSFFNPRENPNSYSLEIEDIIDELSLLGPLNEKYYPNSQLLPTWFIEFFNDFLTENKRRLIKKKCLFELNTIDSKFLFNLKKELNSYLNYITQRKFDFLTTIFSNYNLSYLETAFQKRMAIILVQDEISNFQNCNESTDFDDLYINLKLEKFTEFKQWQDLPELPEHLRLF
ncbi:hypothetical protein [uncultured Desulfobacter sp.]|uniref:hypothetical protein n=1 Tax=uncultured Desulfobacter sp. TaxID=240139 RepID=UPI0029C6AAAC|nr:hypothetical protein [uncultured Desulfobacter sp.]